MNCPNCNTEMIEGRLGGHGTIWYPSNYRDLVVRVAKIFGLTRYYVQAFRCPQCNKIELVAAQTN